MNKRHREIILYIEECQKYNRKCSLDRLIDHFHVSERTIRYDLDAISRFFTNKHLPSLLMDEDGNITFLANHEEIEQVLQNNDFYSFKLNKNERAEMIAYLLLEATDTMTLQELADVLLVSRSTIIHDVNNTRKIIMPYGLEIVPLSKGLQIVGKESNRRVVLMNISNQMKALDYYEGQTKNQLSKTDIKILGQIIQDNELRFKMFLTDRSFSELLQYLNIMMREINKGRSVEIDYVLQHPSMSTLANHILDVITSTYGIKMMLTEKYLLSDILYNLKYIKRNDIDDQLMRIQIIAKEFIDHVNQDIHVNIKNDFQFYQNLVNHLQSTFQDIQVNTNIDRGLLQTVIQNNPQVVQAIQQNIGPLEEVAGRKISEEEIAYITIHVQAAIERSREHKNSISVLLVSDTGLGEVTFLVSKLRRFFNFNIVSVIPQHALSTYDVNNVGLILTTVPIQENRCESILVTPDLNDEECIVLGDRIEHIKSKKKHSDIDENFRKLQIQLANEIQESPLNKETIYKNIISVLRQFVYPDSHQNIQAILAYLLKGHIEVDVEADDWQEAIRKSACVLLAEKYINEVYIDQMIVNVEEDGPYIVLAQGVAVPHASPYMGGYQLGMYLIRLKKAVFFGDKAVRYVFCLSTVDKDSHLKPMFHLMNLLANPEFIQSLDQSESPDEIYSVIRDYEEML